MSDSRTTEAERRLQKRFSIEVAAGAVLLLAAIAFFRGLFADLPDRRELGPRTAQLRLEPVRLAKSPLRLAGAWEVTSDDPRFGGVSGLAFDGSQLVALTDSGVLARFAPPTGIRGSAEIDELRVGPGSAHVKRNRDSEALVRDPAGRGWWVAFENRNELWLYDQGFARAREHVQFGRKRWRANVGIEGVAAADGGLLLFPENSGYALRLVGGRARRIAISGLRGRISEAASFDGRIVLIERSVTPLGFSNSLLIVETRDQGLIVKRRVPLPLGPFDNAEALAVEPRPGGPSRFWLMTDDNKQRPMRTLLIAFELPD